jgi:hypothetical protein
MSVSSIMRIATARQAVMATTPQVSQQRSPWRTRAKELVNAIREGVRAGAEPVDDTRASDDEAVAEVPAEARALTVAEEQTVSEAKTDIKDLASLVPTEVVVFYTTVIGILAGLLKDYPNSHVRPASMGNPGRRSARRACRRVHALHCLPRDKFPLLELVAAEVAFVAWGIVVPGSVLYFILDLPTLPLTVGVVTAIGTFLVVVVFRSLIQKKLYSRAS